jgi:hypothetical protein
MMLSCYSIYDRAVESFAPPFCAPNPAVAERMFRDAAQEKESLWNKHPEDFQLFEVGNFDQDTAQLIGHNVPLLICKLA